MKSTWKLGRSFYWSIHPSDNYAMRIHSTCEVTLPAKMTRVSFQLCNYAPINTLGNLGKLMQCFSTKLTIAAPQIVCYDQ
jgi:hypothetical protein